MILVSLGNLGDLIVQLAFLKGLDAPSTSVALPEAYASAANELFPSARVIKLPDQLSDARLLAARGIGRPAALAAIQDHLRASFPAESVHSLMLTYDIIERRELNFYDAYLELFSRDPALWAFVNPKTAEEVTRAGWHPFSHFPRWSPPDSRGAVVICPLGGLPIKAISPDDLEQLMGSLERSGLEPIVLFSRYDDITPYRFQPQRFHRLGDTGAITEAAELLARSELVISVDTAWYHLAALIGAPVFGIAGPRSAKHFHYPRFSSEFSSELLMACADCYSSLNCFVSGEGYCAARPPLSPVLSGIGGVLSGLGRSAEAEILMKQARTLPVPRSDWKQAPIVLSPPGVPISFAAMDWLRKFLLEPLLASPLRLAALKVRRMLIKS